MQMKVRALRACYLNDQLFSEGQEAVLDLPEDHPMLGHFEVLSPKKRTKAAPATQAQPEVDQPADPAAPEVQAGEEPTA